MSSSGYPDGARTTPVPDLFFSRDLAELADPVALTTLLFVLWRVHRRDKGAPAAVAEKSVVGHETLRSAVAGAGDAAELVDEAIRGGLFRLVERGLLLESVAQFEEGPDRWLFVNNQEGRTAHARWREQGRIPPVPDGPPAVGVHRPNVFALYEANIGALTPMIAEELKDAQDTYPDEWIEQAIRLAVENNVRRWAYARAILERWSTQGRDDAANRRGAEEDRERDSEGPYADWVRR